MVATTRKALLFLLIVPGITVMAIAAYIGSGRYNVAADQPHTDAVHALLETVRERSIAVRADNLQVPPDLDEQARIVHGAGNYAAMCTGCHLAPGMSETEMSRGLYPAPPNLTHHTVGYQAMVEASGGHSHGGGEAHHDEPRRNRKPSRG